MASTVTLNASNSQSVTISGLNSLASTSTAASSAIDNSTNLFLSAIIQVSLIPNATTNATGYVNVWLIRSTDGGTTYDSTGVLLGTIPMPSVANTTTIVQSLSTELAGPLGTSWKVAIENRTGQALKSSGNSVQFTGITYTIS